MLKRIRLNELRVGMFINEVEHGARHQSGEFNPFLISSPSEIDRLMKSNVMTIVIDLRKGLDAVSASQSLDRAQFDAQLLTTFSAKEIEEAKHCIEEVKPHIRKVLAEARLHGAFAAAAANTAVETIMSAAMENAGALIGIAKLKEWHEVTFLHSLAVSALMIKFGRNLGLSEDEVRVLGVGGLVHDLGKMALPRSILTKPGKLTVEEMDIVRMHPHYGHRLVSQIEVTPKQVLAICLYHHEKFDGSGYPYGLMGEQIPRVARLAAICDVYDALTTIRSYKRAWSRDEATNAMLSSPGHFDPTLLATFVSQF